ncbi:MAG: paraquat-inducible protein A [Rhodobacteraceae bacterium]|nr:paraquat-inducible protein A [Paracoccaceae bacterium]
MTAHLIACPRCDALYRFANPANGERAVCARCHKVLVAPRLQSETLVIVLAITIVILIFGAVYFPFLNIRVAGLSNAASLLDAALVFAKGPLFILPLAVLGMIIIVPLARALLVIYALGPLVAGHPAAPGALRAFALSETLRPWAMAEVFALGCAVALVKASGLAIVGFGPAFWLFGLLVVASLLQDNLMCRWSVWAALDEGRI